MCFFAIEPKPRIREYDLNLDHFDDLGELGIFAYISSEIEYSDELVQALVIHKTVADLKDLMDGQ